MKIIVALVTIGAICLTACEEKPKSGATKAAPTSTAPTVGSLLPTGFFLGEEPADVRPVEEVKASAKVGDVIALRGRIGGSMQPFVAGRAVFTVMGPGIKSCSDNPDDACATPWDYCCESAQDIASHAATVQIVDASGSPLKVDVKGQNGVKELSDVIVVGKVAQAEGKVLVVNATGMFIAKK